MSKVERAYPYLILTTVFCTCFTYAGTFDLGVRLFPSEILFCLSVLIFPWIIIRNRHIQLFNRMDLSLTISLLIFIFLHLLSVLYVAFIYHQNNNTFNSIKEFIRVITTMPFVILIIILYRNKLLNLFSLIKAFIFSGVCSALYAIYQFISVLLIKKYFPLLPNSSVYPNVNGRGVGTFMEGGYAVLFFGIALSFLLYLQQEKIHGFSVKCFTTLSVILILGILVTESTSGIAAGLVCMFVYLFSNEERLQDNFTKKQNLIILVILFALACLTFIFFQEKILSMFNGVIHAFKYGVDGAIGSMNSFSAEDRLVKIFKGLFMFFAHPIFGIGLRQYSFNYMLYPPKAVFTQDIATVVPLNVYVEILSELGFLGIISFLFVILVLIRKTNRMNKILTLFVLLNFLTYPSYKMFFIWCTFGILYLIKIDENDKANCSV
jgi:O-antigen ligase